MKLSAGRWGPGWGGMVLPRASRQYLTDYDPARTDASMRRLYAFATAGLATLSLLVWLATRML